MKKLLPLLLLFSSFAAAQNTVVSSSMVDTDGIAWASGTWRIDFRPNPSFPNESTYRLLNGQPLSAATLHQNGVLDSNGHFSITIYDSTLIAPTGSGWTLTLCSLTIAPCGTYQFSSAGTTMDISSNLTSNIAAPRFTATAGAFGYADVEVQTSLNQGASYWNVTTGTQHIWNGTTWVVGGGGATLPPGLSSDGNNGLNVVGGITAGGPVTASSFPGYRQNQVNARSRNRDEVLQITATPQDMPGCANSGQGLADDAPCFVAAMQYLASSDKNAIKRLIIPNMGRTYNLISNNYLVNLPYDYGDYSGYPAYITQGAVALNFVSGALASCSVSGGSGYVSTGAYPNGMQVAISDPTGQGSGANAVVQTNSSGVPTGCTVVNPGINYPPAGVSGTIIPQGGDGAQVTCSLSGGTFTGSTCTINAGGLGYSSSISGYMPGLSCSPMAVTMTVGAGGTSVTGATVTGGSGCVYGPAAPPVNAAFTTTTTGGTLGVGPFCYRIVALDGISPTPGNSLPSTETCTGTLTGSTNTVTVNWGLVSGAAGYQVYGRTTGAELLMATLKGYATSFVDTGSVTPSGALPTTSTTGTNTNPTVPVAIGASCGGAPCTNLAPETPTNIGCAVPLFSGITIEGVGTPVLSTSWSGVSFTNPQRIAFCDPYGSAQDITIKNLSIINTFIGFYFPFETHHIIWDNIYMSTVGIGIYAYSFGGAWNYNYGRSNHARSSFSNGYFFAYAPIVCAGAYSGRNPQGNAGASLHLLNMLSYNGLTWTPSNFYDPDMGGRCTGIDVSNLTNTMSPSAANGLAMDQWFETNIWKSQNGPAAPATYSDGNHLLSNGLASTNGNGISGAGCSFHATSPMNDRTADANFGYVSVGSNPGTYPFYQCYPGISWSALTFYPRYSQDQGTVTTWPVPPQEIKGLMLIQSNRTYINGRFDWAYVHNIANNSCGAGGWGDPYRPAGAKAAALNFIAGNINTGAVASNVIQYCPPTTAGAQILTFGRVSTSNPLITTAVSYAPGYNPNPIPYNTLIEQIFPGIAGSTVTMGPLTNCGASGSLLGPGATFPVSAQSTSAAAANSCAGFYSAGFNWRINTQPNLIGSFGYSASGDYNTTARTWVGLYSNLNGCTIATMTQSDTPACSYAAFRYSPSATPPDTAFQFCTDNNSGTPNCQSMGWSPPVNFGTSAFVYIQIYYSGNYSVVGCLNTYTPANFGNCVTSSKVTGAQGVYYGDMWTNTVTAAGSTAKNIRVGPVYGTCQVAGCN